MSPETLGALLEARLPTAAAAPAAAAPPPAAAAAAAADPFGAALGHAAASLEAPQQAAAAAVQHFAAGNDGELHRTMLAVERADISLKLLVSVRNRALEAYREIMHMGS